MKYFTLNPNFLVKNWEMQPILSRKEEFISSDHPSILFAINDCIASIFCR